MGDVKRRSEGNPEPCPATESPRCPQDRVQQCCQWQEDDAEQREDEGIEGGRYLSWPQDPEHEEGEPRREPAMSPRVHIPWSSPFSRPRSEAPPLGSVRQSSRCPPLRWREPGAILGTGSAIVPFPLLATDRLCTSESLSNDWRDPPMCLPPVSDRLSEVSTS